MAREIRIVRRSGQQEVDGRRPPIVGPEPQSTEEARRAIEQTRGRISSTLDAIEDRIGTTREEIKDRIDVVTPARERIREHRGMSLGIAFGAGLLLALMTGGGEMRGGDHERRHRTRMRARDEAMLDEEDRKELRRWRAERRARLGHRMGRRRGRSEALGFHGATPHPEEGTLAVLRNAVARGVKAGLGDRWRSVGGHRQDAGGRS